MSSGFILAVIGAPLKLTIVYVSFSLFLILSEFVFSGFASLCMLRCILSYTSVKPPVSMRLRPKRFVCLVCLLYLFFPSFVSWYWCHVFLMVSYGFGTGLVAEWSVTGAFLYRDFLVFSYS